MLEFYDASGLFKPLYTHVVAPHEPVMLCAAKSSALLYVDWSKIPFEVQWWDLSDAQPKPAAGKRVIHTQQRNIRDMCYVQNGGKELLIIAAGREGVFAYSTLLDKLEWKVDGTLPEMKKDIAAYGVATDGHSHLFVADYDNHCIQMFSASDGSYLRCLVVKGTKSLGQPDKIRWCEKSSFLLSICWWKGKWHLKMTRRRTVLAQLNFLFS